MQHFKNYHFASYYYPVFDKQKNLDKVIFLICQLNYKTFLKNALVSDNAKKQGLQLFQIT